jgi:hypothetical protein
MKSNFGSFRSRPSLSMVLVLAIVLLSTVWIVGLALPMRPLLPLWVKYVSGWSQILANLALAAIGLKTPQRNAWLIYLGFSVVTLVAFGSTPLTALWFFPGLLKSFLG